MTVGERIEAVKRVSGETDIAVVSEYLDMAKGHIMRRRFPYGTTLYDVPEEYHYIQIEVAVYLLNKRGAEGQTSHNENGISRGYESASVPASLLRNIVPYCKVVK